MFKNLFKKQKQIEYVVKDHMLEKQNKIINSLIRISLDDIDTRKAAEQMITIIKKQYNIKNCSLFINKEGELKYLATDIDVTEYREAIKSHINSIKTNDDAVFFDRKDGKCLSYPYAEEREIVYSIFVYLKKVDSTIGAIYIELDNKDNIKTFEQEIFTVVMETMTLALENLIIRRKLIILSKEKVAEQV